MQPQEEEIHLLDYWKVLLKRRRVALSFFAIVVGIVMVYSFAATPIYKGTAQVLIDLEKNPTMTFAEGSGAFIQMKDSAEYYKTQTEILASRAFGDRVVRKLQLDKNPYILEKQESAFTLMKNKMKDLITSLFPARAKQANPIPLAAIQEELSPELTTMVLGNMEVEIGKGSNILKINYYSDNPLVAAAMANGIANAYIEHNLDIRVKPFRDAVEWLSARMIDSRAKVEDSEKVVQQYKETKGIVSFEPMENVITQKLQEIMTQLVQAESKRQETEVRYKQIQSVINNTELLATVPDIMNNPVIQSLRTDELAVKRKISDLSEKFGPKHPNIMRAQTELKSIQKNLISEARKMLSAAKSEYDIARGRENSLRKAMEEQKLEVLDLGRKAIDYGVIEGEAMSNKQFYELLLKKLQEASLSSGINVSNAQIVDGATIPDSPAKPKRLLNMLLAVFVGLFGGIFAAFFVEYMDDTIKTPDDIEKLLAIPFLGYVPATNKEEGPIYMFSGPRANIAESYRSIRTSIMLSSTEEEPLHILLVTSTTPHEGKTTTAANLAIAMAQLGERVLLIDTDMRRHNLHKVFGLDNLIGISDMIVDHTNTAAAIRSVSSIPNLSIITGGTLAPNPSELLGSNSMRLLMSKLRSQYDRIILDSPPVMVFSDGLVLSRLADGVIFVVWGAMTGRDNIKKSVQAISGVNSRILGIVLNNIDLTSKSSYYYYHPYYNYHYYYGEKGEEKMAKKGRNTSDTGTR
jgi:capsular exopolysaccharide synthesis family protein